jgi:hypothetical protein
MPDTPGQHPDSPPDRPADATTPLSTPAQPAAADTSPPAEQPPTTPPPPATPVPVAAEPAGPGRFRRFAGARATQLVAAGLVGLLLGGLAVGLVDNARDDRDGGPAAVREHRGPGGPFGPGERGQRFERDFRGGPDRDVPRRGNGDSQPG